MPTRVRYSIVASTTLVAVLLYLDRNCISMIAKDDDFRSAFGIGQEGAFAVMAMFYLAYALAQVPAGWLADRQRANIVEASMCKAVAAEVGQEVTSLGMELIGTVGARGDHLIEKLYRDVKAMDLVEGTGQIQRVIMARHLVDLPRD